MVALFLIGAALGCACMTTYDLLKENKYLTDSLDKKAKKKEVK